MANTRDTPDNNKYSFVMNPDLVVSSGSVVQLDDANVPKQKRRRTSPRDHAILEAAYQRNSKPDKHERTEIVDQVELGEKEVQIWFQNRRQNDRRKSKPLQPHELLAHFRNGMPVSIIQQTNTDGENIAQSSESTSTSTSAPDVPRPSSRSSSIRELLNPSSLSESTSPADKQVHKIQTVDPLPTPPSSFESTKKSDNKAGSAPAMPDLPTTIQEPKHSRKRSHEVMNTDSGSKLNAICKNECPVLPQPKPLARTSSFVRLAMTVDGAVKVRTSDEPTPSPPKQRVLPPNVPARTRESLGRSQSAMASGFDFKNIEPPLRRVGGAGFGRSRDARTWEFYCDRDSGDALLAQAEAERSGSAVGAINLIRSRSQRNNVTALSPNPIKQNARQARISRQNGQPKLARTKSSMGRLQTLDMAVGRMDESSKRPKHERSPSGDSDKENWAPGTTTSQHAMRRIHPSAARDSILQENDFPSARDPPSDHISQEQENRSMAGKTKAKGDDLDCIQGLLSLSQGAWR